MLAEVSEDTELLQVKTEFGRYAAAAAVSMKSIIYKRENLD